MHKDLKAETTRPAAHSFGAQQRRFDAFRRTFNEVRPQCPVTAIFTEEEVPPGWESYTAKNRDVFTSDQPPTAPKR